MKLHEAKILRGDLAGTRMEWFCGEFESLPSGSPNGPKYIGCIDITTSNTKPVYFTNKGQPPESFDFKKDAYSSFEQIAFAQITMMEWDKLNNGDKISVDEDMEDKIREWGGRIWEGGSVVTTEKVNELIHLKLDTNLKRDIEGRYLLYQVKNKEF